MTSRRFEKSHGPTQRQLRVGEHIRRTLSEMLMRGEVHDPDLTRLSITVSEVRVTPDLSIATAFVLPLGGKDADIALKALARNKGKIRHRVGKGMRLRHTPDLRFLIDDSFDRADATRALFDRDEVRRDLDGDDPA